ncbi:hypothetical protein PoB_003388500 [Plakobranchus ocellatus]|uniref:Uncharacterized protein n=1 Tax=Plakobranchus ocellatus TaxID=259542 RepID=A0AAV4AKK2_9GAST|nr:hypothetical protein PoB_003388500 [Plakobranchus ocellatus]
MTLRHAIPYKDSSFKLKSSPSYKNPVTLIVHKKMISCFKVSPLPQARPSNDWTRSRYRRISANLKAGSLFTAPPMPHL